MPQSMQYGGSEKRKRNMAIGVQEANGLVIQLNMKNEYQCNRENVRKDKNGMSKGLGSGKSHLIPQIVRSFLQGELGELNWTNGKKG